MEKNSLTILRMYFRKKPFSLDYTEISSVRCSMMKSIQAVSSLNSQSSPRLGGHTPEMGNIFLCFFASKPNRFNPLLTRLIQKTLDVGF